MKSERCQFFKSIFEIQASSVKNPTHPSTEIVTAASSPAPPPSSSGIFFTFVSFNSNGRRPAKTSHLFHPSSTT
jgi:hypothetical protein